MDKLPDEIVMKIFDYLNPITKLMCGVVSKRFKVLIDTSLRKHLWVDFHESLVIYESHPDLHVDFVACFRTLLCKFKKISRLVLNIKKDELSLEDFRLLQKFHSVTCFELSFGDPLYFSGPPIVWENAIHDAISRWNNLKIFKLCHVYVNDNFVINLLTSLPSSIVHFRMQLFVISLFRSHIHEINDALETYIELHPKTICFQLDLRFSISTNANYDLVRTIRNLHKFCPDLKTISLGRHTEDVGDLSFFKNLKSLKFNHVYDVLAKSELSAMKSVSGHVTSLTLSARLFATRAPPTLICTLPLLQNLHIFRDYLYSSKCKDDFLQNASQIFLSLPNLRSICVPLMLLDCQFLKFPLNLCHDLNAITCSTIVQENIFERLLAINALASSAKIERGKMKMGSHVTEQKICIRLMLSTKNYESVIEQLDTQPMDCLYIVNYAN